MTEFGPELRWTFVMGGLARDYTEGHEDPEEGIGGARGVYPSLVAHWLDAAAEDGMPLDPRIWLESPLRSTYPAAMAAKAAAEQADDDGYRYLRALRQGIMCFRRKLDTTEALVEEARGVGLDVERFRIDLASHATVEAFGADLEEAERVPDEARAQGKVKKIGGRERVTFPSLVFEGGDGSGHGVFGVQPYEAYREAAEAAGATPTGADPPGVLEALRRFGRMATLEVETVCGLPGPPARAELWRLASEWKLRAIPVLTGELWELT
jgi:putative protein-disulfide isomerase